MSNRVSNVPCAGQLDVHGTVDSKVVVTSNSPMQSFLRQPRWKGLQKKSGGQYFYKLMVRYRPHLKSLFAKRVISNNQVSR